MDILLLELDKRYSKNGLNFKKALDTWKENRLSAEEIRSIITADIGERVTLSEAKFLQRSGKEIYEDNKVYSDFMNSSIKEIQQKTASLEKISSSKIVKLTPEVKSIIEKVGNNTYRSKYGSVQWSIILVDGQPHLARKETDDSLREEKLADGLND